MAIFATAPDESSRWLPGTAASSRGFAARCGERQLLVLEVDGSDNDALLVPIPARERSSPRAETAVSLLEHQCPHWFGIGGPNAPPVPPAMPDWLSAGAPGGVGVGHAVVIAGHGAGVGAAGRRGRVHASLPQNLRRERSAAGGGCVEEAHCAGLHVNHGRRWGFAVLDWEAALEPEASR